MIHELKIDTEYFMPVVWGNKNFELRYNDRNFQVGDELILKEWLPIQKIYTASEVTVKITYVLKNICGLKDGYVILSFKNICADLKIDSERLEGEMLRKHYGIAG